MNENWENVYFVGGQKVCNALLAPCAELRFRVEPFASAHEFIEAAPVLRPGCLIAETDGLEVPGATFLQALEKMGVAFPAILIGGHSPPPGRQRLTVISVLREPLGADLLARLLGEARRFLRAGCSDEPDLTAVGRLISLTRDERDVLSRIAAGMTNKAMASSLRMDIRAVELYRIGLMKKLEVRSLSELIRLALEGGLRIIR